MWCGCSCIATLANSWRGSTSCTRQNPYSKQTIPLLCVSVYVTGNGLHEAKVKLDLLLGSVAPGFLTISIRAQEEVENEDKAIVPTAILKLSEVIWKYASHMHNISHDSCNYSSCSSVS